jgi:hypothetical protein
MHVTTLIRALAILALADTAVAGAQSSALTGAWERVSLRDSTGTILQPPAPAAFAIYSSDGYFSQTAIPAGRPIINKPFTDMTKEDLVERFQNVNAMRGTYTISGNRLTRKSVSATNPAGEGRELVQVFRIAGDTLILTSPNSTNRGEAKFVRAR